MKAFITNSNSRRFKFNKCNLVVYNTLNNECQRKHRGGHYNSRYLNTQRQQSERGKARRWGIPIASIIIYKQTHAPMQFEGSKVGLDAWLGGSKQKKGIKRRANAKEKEKIHIMSRGKNAGAKRRSKDTRGRGEETFFGLAQLGKFISNAQPFQWGGMNRRTEASGKSISRGGSRRKEAV